MARQARIIHSGLIHHVVQRGHNQGLVFMDDADRRRYLEVLRDALRDRQTSLFAYALLPDHIHLLLLPPQAKALAQVMQDVGRRYVSVFNQRHERTGTLWDGRFRAHAVQPGRPVLEVLALIESHAWRKGLASDLLVSPWCSTLHHLGQGRDMLVQDPPEFWELGNTPFERELRWRDFLQGEIQPERFQAIAACVRSGEIHGSVDFVAARRQQAGLASQRRPRGRPRKQALTESGGSSEL